MNTIDLGILGDTIYNASESIIAETENAEECINDGALLYTLSFGDIRDSAEELQLLIDQYGTLEEIKNESINLYQNVKYIVEDLENEYSSIMTDEVCNSFGNIRTYVDIIRESVNTLLSKQAAWEL